MSGTRSVAIKFSLHGPIAFVIGLAFWLSANTDTPRKNSGDPAAARAASATLAPPSLPVRLGTASLTAISHGVRGTDRWLAPLSFPRAFARLRLGGNCGSMPSGNGHITCNSLALTFPYDATAPPAFIRS
jgi:hypothetical protein